jgi:hypothetical protein
MCLAVWGAEIRSAQNKTPVVDRSEAPWSCRFLTSRSNAFCSLSSCCSARPSSTNLRSSYCATSWRSCGTRVGTNISVGRPMVLRSGTRDAWLHRRWTRRSRCTRPGRPPVDRDLRALVAEMASANSLWGAPRIHGCGLTRPATNVSRRPNAATIGRFRSSRTDEDVASLRIALTGRRFRLTSALVARSPPPATASTLAPLPVGPKREGTI